MEKVMEMSNLTEDNVMDERWLEGMVHDGVRCVDCNITPIEGKRFECDQCYDYNLCEECWTNTASKKKPRPSLTVPPPIDFTSISFPITLQVLQGNKRRACSLSSAVIHDHFLKC